MSKSVPQDLDNERVVGNGVEEDLLGRVSSDEIKGFGNGIPRVGGSAWNESLRLKFVGYWEVQAEVKIFLVGRRGIAYSVREARAKTSIKDVFSVRQGRGATMDLEPHKQNSP